VIYGAIASAALILAGCTHVLSTPPGEDALPTPCDQILEGCIARRLNNVVLHGDEEVGAFGPIDGLDATDVIGFDEALATAGANDLRADEAETVQVVLGRADAERLHWGSGGASLFYAVKWGGVHLPCFGPAGCPNPPQLGTWTSVIDATTGRWIGSGG
jgi:hypothetical protein